MTKLASWQCSCSRYAELECDWPGCDKPVCRKCARHIEGKDYCPFHRGDPPHIAERKRLEAEQTARWAAEAEAEKARKMFGLKGAKMKKGFTLIEISIVLVVVGLLTTGALKMFAGMATSARLTSTQNVLHLAEQALIVYAQQNTCLPCPANGALSSGSANAGRALDAGGASYSGCTNNGCWSAAGVLPWLTLGLSEQEATDAWNARLSYHLGGASIAGDATDSACGSATTSVSAEKSGGLVLETITQTVPPNRTCAPQGTLEVNNASGIEQTGGVGNRAVYVLISHGPDGYGGWLSTGAQRSGSNNTTAQIANAGDTGPFVQDVYSAPSHFDDIVSWRAGALAVAKCGTGLCGNPN